MVASNFVRGGELKRYAGTWKEVDS